MDRRTLLGVPLRAGPEVLDLLPALAAALDGSGPALMPLPPSAARTRESLPDDEPTGDPLALVVATSGSTGVVKAVLLPGSALRASAAATAQVLGGPGTWLLALPAHHVAGAQVLVRSVLAGTTPVAMDLAGGFTAQTFAAAADLVDGPKRYVSLVPTQLVRLLPDGLAALRRFDAVLLGGAAAPPALVEQARAAGVQVVRTYGMSETCGGCVYDGVPLPGVDVRLGASGRITLGGSVVARGYRGGAPFRGRFVTDDIGRWAADGTVDVLGRADDMVITGAELVAPALVESALHGLPGVVECAVFGRPDPEWGQRVVAVVVPTGVGLRLTELRTALATSLPGSALPRELVTLGSLPMRGPGKVDRQALASLPVGEVLTSTG